MASSESGYWQPATGSSGEGFAIRALAFALTFAFAPSSWALFQDRVEVFAGQNVSYDSNVFRISDQLDPRATIGVSSLSDTSTTTLLGFNLDIPISLQRIQAGYTWTHTRYNRFDDLNFSGGSGRLAYLFAYEDKVTGEVGVTHQKGLSTFTNIQQRIPDFVTSKVFYANGAWLMTPRWRLHGVFNYSEQEHSATQRLVQDLERTSTEAGLSYVTPQANRIGGAVRVEKGRLPTDTVISGVSFDNSYDQVGAGFVGHWTVSGLSQLDGRVEYVKREYDQQSSRNYSGPMFALSWTYTPTGKLTFLTTASRDIGPLEDINTSFVLVTGITVKPTWAVSEKVSVQGNLGYSVWEYTAVGGNSFENRVRNVGVGVAWRPFTRVLVQAGVSREKRTSTLQFSDYTVDLATLEARVGF